MTLTLNFMCMCACCLSKSFSSNEEERKITFFLLPSSFFFLLLRSFFPIVLSTHMRAYDDDVAEWQSTSWSLFHDEIDLYILNVECIIVLLLTKQKILTMFILHYSDLLDLILPRDLDSSSSSFLSAAAPIASSSSLLFLLSKKERNTSRFLFLVDSFFSFSSYDAYQITYGSGNRTAL